MFFKLTVSLIPPLLVLQLSKIVSIKYCQFSFKVFLKLNRHQSLHYDKHLSQAHQFVVSNH